jgi:bifunctional non-homologous end joining protein LigD
MRTLSLQVIKGFGLQELPHAEPPSFIKPMLATLVNEPFDKTSWIFEPKWDGYRAIADIHPGKVRLYSRNFKSYEEKFPTLIPALEGIRHQAVIDGEIVALNSHGKANFQLLQTFQKTRRGTLIYYVFDILYLDGYDVRSLPLYRRKELLELVIKESEHIRLTPFERGEGRDIFERAMKFGEEGVIAKNRNGIYHSGDRSSDWLKIKTHLRQEAVICGYTKPRKSKEKQFGSLILGLYEAGRLVCVGHTTSEEFDPKFLRDILQKLKPLERSESPFEVIPFERDKTTWVKPELVCEVSFQRWTPEGYMSRPSFEGLRPDKPATSVHREVAKNVSLALRGEEEGPAEDEEPLHPPQLTIITGEKRL